MSDNVRDDLADYLWVVGGGDPVDTPDVAADAIEFLAERGMVVLGPDGEPLNVRALVSLIVDEQGDPVDLLTAEPGDMTEIYQDVEGLTESGWVAHLDYFDDYQTVKVRRIRLRVLEREDIVLHADDEAAAEVEG